MKKRLLAMLLMLCLVFVYGACTDIEGDFGSEEQSSENHASKGDSSVNDSSKPDESNGDSSGSGESRPDNSSPESTPDSSDASSTEDSSVESAPDESSADVSVPDDNETVVSFLACPDNIIHPSVYYHALETAAKNKGVAPDYSNLGTADYDFSGIYKNVASYIKSADISYINLETLIGGNDNPISGYPTFNSPEAAGEQLLELGFDVFNLAHNHMLDSFNDKYLINCNRFFTERGATTIGYYKDKSAIDDIVVVESKGVKIAFLSYTYETNGIRLSSSASTYIPYISESLIEKQMAKAKQVADLVFVSMHWGSEDSFNPGYDQRSTAQKLVDLGADVIIGMHPHVIQEAKWVTREDGSRCFLTYSLGNFVSGMYGGKNALGSMLSLDIVKKAGQKPTVENVKIIPTVCHYEKGTSVDSKTDTGFRKFQIYLLKDYTAELAAAHGVHKNGSKISSFDKELDGNFSLETLNGKVNKLIPAEFLS